MSPALVRRVLLGAFALALVPAGCACGSGDSSPTPDADTATVPFKLEEVLSNPTATSVQLALWPRDPAELHVEYWEAPGGAVRRTETQRSSRDDERALVFRLEGLAPDREYLYRVSGKAEGGALVERAEASVRTLRREEGGTFRFAYGADSHITGVWVQSQCEGKRNPELMVANFRRTLDNVLRSDVDFIVAGGDTFMTHLWKFKPCGELEALGHGTVRTAQQADLRYELALSSGLWGKLTRQLPFFYVLGNHDGEARYGDSKGSYGHFEDTRELSRAARLRHLPDPTAVYDGSKDQDLYFSFVSGDARFIILDVMAGPRDYPKVPEDWTLGSEQLAWFERILKTNDRTWTFVFIEHLDGGIMRPDGLPLPHPGGAKGGHAYGRGSMRATLDSTPRGRFRGEQALLQKLMRENGVDVFFHGHDHIAIVGEKKAPDGRGEGVYYAMAGQFSGDDFGPGWARFDWFQEQVDYDEDGVADFLTGANASSQPGFYRVTVKGSESVELAYVMSSSQPELDGTVAFRVTIHADGTSSLD